MKQHTPLLPVALLGSALLAIGSAAGQVTSPVQSPARPYNLDIVAPVQLAASDAASSEFQAQILPGMTQAVKVNLGEGRAAKNLGAIGLDPSRLVLAHDADIRVYFVGEGASFRNSLGISTTGGGPLSADAALLFPNASDPMAMGGSGQPIRTTTDPLRPGDFVDVGSMSAGTRLDFFLIAMGATGGRNAFSTNVSLNSDGLVHAVSLATSDSAYLLIGFEDVLGGGDLDYNDVVFAVHIGKANVDHLVNLGAPEPTLAMGSMFAAAALLGLGRRRR